MESVSTREVIHFTTSPGMTGWVSNIFNFHPLLAEMIEFDYVTYFKWVGSTTTRSMGQTTDQLINFNILEIPAV